jgi:hypothetical protein
MNELDMVSEINADEPRAGSARLATARERLMATIAEEKVTPIATTGRKHRKVRVASWSTVGVAAAAAAVVVLGGTSSTPTPTTPAPTKAAFVLNEAADRTINEKDQPIHPGEYRYVGQRQSYVSVSQDGKKTVFAWRWTAAITTWIPYDQADPWTQDTHRVGPPKVLIDDGANEDAKYGMNHLPVQGRETARCGDFHGKLMTGEAQCAREFEHKQFNSAMAAAMPRDPHELLTSAYLGTGPETVLQRSGLVLGSGLVPADLRAAIYRAIALLPGIQITDDFANLDGRKGIALGMNDENIIIDPDTGQFIGYRTLDNGKQGMPKGTVVYSSSMVTGVVDEVGQVPGH